MITEGPPGPSGQDRAGAKSPAQHCHIHFKHLEGLLWRRWLLLLVTCCMTMFQGIFLYPSLAQQQPPPMIEYGPWDASEDLNEQHKGLLRFILSGDTSFWSRPAVAYRIGFGTAPWRCISNCQTQYYASAAECAPNCISYIYCEPGGSIAGIPNTTCCSLSLLDQSYSFGHPPNTTTPDWCSTYPPWGLRPRASVCDFNVYSARGVSPPFGGSDPFISVSCKRVSNVTTFRITGALYRNDTARRIMYHKEIQTIMKRRNVVNRISLRHVAAWHHPAINIDEPPQFSLVDDLVCLPLEEIYFEDVYFRPEHEGLAVLPDRRGPNATTFDLWNHKTWVCDIGRNKFVENVNGSTSGMRTSYFKMMLEPCGLVRALAQRNVTSLNPNLALRNVALGKCLFSPFAELNAMRWSLQAQLLWRNKSIQAALSDIKYGNDYYPKGWEALAPDPVAARPFLPDTLKRLTIKRTNDGSHPSKTWRGKPVIKGFLPSEWALLSNLEYLDLSDDMGQGLIEGPIPSTWLMMTKLRTINLTGHPNFCKDWHRIVAYIIAYSYSALRLRYGFPVDVPSRYYGKVNMNDRKFQWNITVFDLDGLGWQWYDKNTGEAGYTNIIAPDGKCCWDTFSDQFEARNYTLEGPSGTSGPWDYDGLSYERKDFCERIRPFLREQTTGLKPPNPPVAPKPPDTPAMPPFPPSIPSPPKGTAAAPPFLNYFPTLPQMLPLRPNAPPQPPDRPNFPLKWAGAWGWEPNIPPRPPPPRPRSPSPPPRPVPPWPAPPPGPRSSPSPLPSPSPPPLPSDLIPNCSLAANQSSFAIPSISRQPFYIAISVVHKSPVLYCNICGCGLAYAVLDRGTSSAYNSSTTQPSALEALLAEQTAKDNVTRLEVADWLQRMDMNKPSFPQGANPNGTDDGIPTIAENLPAAAWRLNPGVDGDYLFKIQVGGSVWYRWVIVDYTPPRVSGQLFMSKTLVMIGSPVTAANAPLLRYYLLQMDMSEPVQKFDLTATLNLNGTAKLVNQECFESADKASAVVKAASSVVLVATAGLPVLAADGPHSQAVVPAAPPPGGGQQQQSIGGGVVEFAAAPGIPFVRSCVAVLYTLDGMKPSITLPEGAVRDLIGNPNILSMTLKVSSGGNNLNKVGSKQDSADDPDLPGAAAALVSATLTATTAATASASSLSLIFSRSSLLQSASHIQILAMTAGFASAGVSSRYRQVAGTLRWSVMSIQGNIPALDNAFGSGNKEVNVADRVSTTLGINLRPDEVNGSTSNKRAPRTTPQPPSLAPPESSSGHTRHHSRRRSILALEVAADEGPGTTTVATSRQVPLAASALLLQAPPPQPAAAPGVIFPVLQQAAELAASLDVLISWLRGLSQFSTVNGSGNSKSAASDDGRSMNMYVIGGAAAGGGGNSNSVFIDSSGRVLNISSVNGNSTMPPPPAVGAAANSRNVSSGPAVLTSAQNLVYTVATAAILMGLLMLCHGLANVIYRVYIGPDLPEAFHFPRVEFSLASPILVAVTFYSCNALGNPDVDEGRIYGLPAVLLLVCVVLPYVLLFWWLTVCRWYLMEKVQVPDSAHDEDVNIEEDLAAMGPLWRGLLGGLNNASSGLEQEQEQEQSNSNTHEGNGDMAACRNGRIAALGVPAGQNATMVPDVAVQQPTRLNGRIELPPIIQPRGNKMAPLVVVGPETVEDGMPPNPETEKQPQEVQQHDPVMIKMRKSVERSSKGGSSCMQPLLSQSYGQPGDDNHSSEDRAAEPSAAAVSLPPLVPRSSNTVPAEPDKEGFVPPAPALHPQRDSTEATTILGTPPPADDVGDHGDRADGGALLDIPLGAVSFNRQSLGQLGNSSQSLHSPVVGGGGGGSRPQWRSFFEALGVLRPPLVSRPTSNSVVQMGRVVRPTTMVEQLLISSAATASMDVNNVNGAMQGKMASPSLARKINRATIHVADSGKPKYESSGELQVSARLRQLKLQLQRPLTSPSSSRLSVVQFGAKTFTPIVKDNNEGGDNTKRININNVDRSQSMLVVESPRVAWERPPASNDEASSRPETGGAASQGGSSRKDSRWSAQISITLPTPAGIFNRLLAAGSHYRKQNSNMQQQQRASIAEEIDDRQDNGSDSRGQGAATHGKSLRGGPAVGEATDDKDASSSSLDNDNDDGRQHQATAKHQSFYRSAAAAAAAGRTRSPSSRGKAHRRVLPAAVIPMHHKVVPIQQQHPSLHQIITSDGCNNSNSSETSFISSGGGDNMGLRTMPYEPLAGSGLLGTNSKPSSSLFARFTTRDYQHQRYNSLKPAAVSSNRISNFAHPDAAAGNEGVRPSSSSVVKQKNNSVVVKNGSGRYVRRSVYRNSSRIIGGTAACTPAHSSALSRMRSLIAGRPRESQLSAEPISTAAWSENTRRRRSRFLTMRGRESLLDEEEPPPDVDKRLLPLYPGKGVPMYMMHYQPGCWPLRLHITPPIYFLAHFEFMFEDALGEPTTQQQQQQAARLETKWILSLGAINVTHKTLLASFLGIFKQDTASMLQLVLLCLLQVAVLTYLMVYRPFIERQRQLMELVAHGLEMMLFVCAAALVKSRPNNHAPSTYFMIVCFLLTSLVVVSYQTVSIFRNAKALFNACMSKLWNSDKFQAWRSRKTSAEHKLLGRLLRRLSNKYHHV
ncbi:hypothetical protein Vafri_8873 [Volvox africanus]|uniref:Uncharacterized protein n=1 Tax=Volvox africanus TaxID=51714 RepID=A0A8J4B7U0_9CHLO|nr:hypothetical protein Vafri_8873 [Volvox africanus]